MKSNIWISYDLGVTGDYEGMYAWLDDQGARECGSSFAFIKDYDHGNERLMKALRRDIMDAVSLGKRSRIYVVRPFRDDEGAVRGGRGRFLVGGRKGTPPWDGYGQQGDADDDEA